MSCPGQLQLNLHCTAFPAAYCKQEAQKNPGKTQEKPRKNQENHGKQQQQGHSVANCAVSVSTLLLFRDTYFYTQGYWCDGVYGYL